MSTTSTFDGNFSFPPGTEVVARTPTTPGGFSGMGFVKLPDRRILVVWNDGEHIYEAYAPNVELIVEEDLWIDDPDHPVTQSKTEILPSDHGILRTSLTEVDGEIYLAVLDPIDANNMTSLKVYRRTGPQAWVLHGTGPTAPWVSSGFGFIGNTFFNVGQIHVHTNGVWIMPCSEIFRESIGGSSFHDHHVGIVASTNGGVTWVRMLAFGGGAGRVFQAAPDVQNYNGTLYWSATLNVSGTFIGTSTDGLTWGTTYIPTNGGPDGSMQLSPILVDDNYLYFSVGNGNAPLPPGDKVVYRTTDILDRDTWEVVHEYETTGLGIDFGRSKMTRVGNYYLWSDIGSRVVGVPVPGGCLPYEPAVGRMMGGRVRVLTDMVRLSRLMMAGAVTQPRAKCEPCEAANAKATAGRSRARLKKVF